MISTSELLSRKLDWLSRAEDLQRCREAQLRHASRTNLFAFARDLAPPEYQFNWHHRLLYSYLDDFAHGRIRRLIIEQPPGTGKSEGCSRNLPAFLFGLDPDHRVIACSYTQDLAAEMNRDVQRIMDSPRYHELFPRTRLGGENVRALAGKPRRNSDIFDIAGARGYYKAAGVGVGITGRRFDRGIIDDPIKDREEANSPTQRERLWRWFTGVFLKRAAKDAGILITATRWHEDDLVGRIKRKVACGDMEPFEVLTLPALATGVHQHPSDPRQVGEALWPWLRTVAELREMERIEPRDFAALEQQNPRAEGATEWPTSYFDGPGFWFTDWPDRLVLRVAGLDPSKGADAKTSDFQALILYGRAHDGTEYVEAELGRRPMAAMLSPDGQSELGEGMCETAHDWAVRFGAEGLVVETNQMQQLLLIPLRLVAKRRGKELPLYGIDNRVRKEFRIQRLGEPFAQRKMRFRNTHGTRLLVEQLKAFPHGQFDDGPDALESVRRFAIDQWNTGKGKR